MNCKIPGPETIEERSARGRTRSCFLVKAALPVAVALLLSMFPAGLHAQSGLPIAEWTLETDPLPQDKFGSEVGPFKPSVGDGALSGVHKNEESKWSSPAGNGSGNSLNADGWAPGDAFVVRVSTAARSRIVVSWDQTRSERGPSSFALSYRLPDGPAKELVTYEVPVVRWSASQASESSSFVADLTGVNEVNDRIQLEFLITPKERGTAANGTTRVDNVRVWGVSRVAGDSVR